MGKAKAQQKLLDNLEDVFGKVDLISKEFNNMRISDFEKKLDTNVFLTWEQVQREHHLPKGDFPNVDQFREVLSGYNFDNFEKLKPKMLQTVDDMLGYDIPELLKNFRNPYD